MSKKILIVEDELIIAADLARILKNNNWNPIATCTSAEEALEKIMVLSPDMVLIDINLRGKKLGTDVANYLLEKDTIPYIFITSLSDKLTLDEVKKTRPMGYIIKPFKPETIISTIEIAFSNHKHRKLDPVRNSETPASDVPFKLRKVTDYIANNLDKKLVVKELSEMTDWQQHHFIRNFKTYIGSTPYQYILEQKISKAKSLLTETNLPISTIAYDLGFQSHSNFSVTFQKSVGTNAENYRRSFKSR
ncbi:response regulator transcription factor [uncultured Aquimarina sp.]|uniref:response regulator transcription factor n=1 Tax=uncultured Aquimarina sp. TaxID=575652 RepID=UPI00263401A9|nr:response regulator transcription factor [uncultured Aquimarina sp.]